MWSKLRAVFHVETAQRFDQAFLARKNFLWSFSAHIRPHNATFAARFEQTKTPAYERMQSASTQRASTRNENAQNTGEQNAGMQSASTQGAGSPKTIIAIIP